VENTDWTGQSIKIHFYGRFDGIINLISANKEGSREANTLLLSILNSRAESFSTY
jgi:hypothetical protein